MQTRSLLPLIVFAPLSGLQAQVDFPVTFSTAETTASLTIPGTSHSIQYVVSGEGEGARYMVLSGLESYSAENLDWLISPFESVDEDGESTGEDGMVAIKLGGGATLDTTDGSTVVGIIPISDDVGSFVGANAYPGDTPPADVQALFRRGRLLLQNGAHTANFGYEVQNESLIEVSPNASSDDPALNLFSGALFIVDEDDLVGVVNTRAADPDTEPPFYKVSLETFPLVDSDGDNKPNLVDLNRMFWETGTSLQNVFRNTDDASVVNRGIGIVYEPEWPWVYAYNLFGGGWMYVDDVGPFTSPGGFWAWSAAEAKWLYFHLRLGRWYWDTTDPGWTAFTP